MGGTRTWSLAKKLRALAYQEEGDALENPERARLKKVVDEIFLEDRIQRLVRGMDPSLIGHHYDRKQDKLVPEPPSDVRLAHRMVNRWFEGAERHRRYHVVVLNDPTVEHHWRHKNAYGLSFADRDEAKVKCIELLLSGRTVFRQYSKGSRGFGVGGSIADERQKFIDNPDKVF